MLKRSDVGTVRAGVEDIPISSMPGVSRLGWQTGLLREVAEARAAGVNSVVIFPKTPDHLKTCTAEEAFNPDGLAQRTFRLLKSKCVSLLQCTHMHSHYTRHLHGGGSFVDVTRTHARARAHTYTHIEPTKAMHSAPMTASNACSRGRRCARHPRQRHKRWVAEMARLWGGCEGAGDGDP